MWSPALHLNDFISALCVRLPFQQKYEKKNTKKTPSGMNKRPWQGEISLEGLFNITLKKVLLWGGKCHISPFIQRGTGSEYFRHTPQLVALFMLQMRRRRTTQQGGHDTWRRAKSSALYLLQSSCGKCKAVNCSWCIVAWDLRYCNYLGTWSH